MFALLKHNRLNRENITIWQLCARSWSKIRWVDAQPEPELLNFIQLVYRCDPRLFNFKTWRFNLTTAADIFEFLLLNASVQLRYAIVATRKEMMYEMFANMPQHWTPGSMEDDVAERVQTKNLSNMLSVYWM